MKPHPSCFLKAVFSFLPCSSITLCVKGEWVEEEDPKVIWSNCILLGEEQDMCFIYTVSLGYVLVLKIEQFKNV